MFTSKNEWYFYISLGLSFLLFKKKKEVTTDISLYSEGRYSPIIGPVSGSGPNLSSNLAELLSFGDYDSTHIQNQAAMWS